MKRVLIVTYDFPPLGGSAVQRVVKFAKYLPHFGWHPVVLTTRHGRPIPRDPSLLTEVAGTEIHRTAAPHPYRYGSMLRRWMGRGYDPDTFTADMDSQGGFFHPAAWLIPDSKIVWIPFALAWALSHKSQLRCDVILSSVPTPSAAILGSLISRLWKVPHVVDYRDPWTGAFYLPRRVKLLRMLEASWEQRILRRTAAVLAVPNVPDYLPTVSTPIMVLHNGFDEDDYTDLSPQRLSDGFMIAHVGRLWKSRNLGPIVHAITALRQRDQQLVQQLHFVQIGRVDGYVSGQLSLLSRKTRVSVVPTVSHREAIGFMLGADLLYLPTIQDYIPGKIYEYLRSGTVVLGTGERSFHVQRLLAETGGGKIFSPEDTEGIANFIERVMKDPQSESPASLEILARYSRQAGTRTLAGVLNSVTNLSSRR